MAASGLRVSARSTPRRWAYMPESPPHSRSKAGCTDATTPSRAKVASQLGRGHLDVLDAVPRGPDRAVAELLRSERQAGHDLPSAPSPMAWKPACSPARVHATTWSRTAAASRYPCPAWPASAYGSRRCAVCDPIEPSAKRSPAAPAVPRSRARATPAGADLAPVGDDLRPGLGCRELAQGLQVLGAGDVRPGQLVDAPDAQRGSPREGGALHRAPLLGADRLAGDPADDVVRVAGQVAGVVVARLAAGLRRRREQGGGHHSGVHVDAGEVDHPAVRRPVELLAGRRPLLRPGRLVPAVPEHDPPAGRPVRPSPRRPRQSASERGAGQVQPGQRQAGGGRVHVRVDEGRQHQGAVEVHHLVGRVAVRPGSLPTQAIAPPRTSRAVAAGSPGEQHPPRLVEGRGQVRHAGQSASRRSKSRRAPGSARSRSSAVAAWPGT